MPTTLTAHAIEKSTFAITASFIDDAGDAVVPNTGLTWTLTDGDGVVVNSHTGSTITPAGSVTIVLHGADLAIAGNADRVLTIQGTYDSDLGTNLEIKDQVTFRIDNLTAVT